MGGKPGRSGRAIAEGSLACVPAGRTWKVNDDEGGIGPKRLRPAALGSAPTAPGPTGGLRGLVVYRGLPKLGRRRAIDTSGRIMGEARSSSSDEVDMDEANERADSDVSFR